ncbi:MAG: acyl-CoA dehydrogenase family protein [Solirubrobacteraceae bacterium]
MSDSSSTATAVKPDLTAVAEGLIGLVDRHAEASEARGALSDEVVDALHDTGLWGMWVPEVLGGAELEPVPSLQVLEHVSYGDASAGWVLMAAALATGCDAAYLGEEAAAELFPGTGRVLVHEGQGTRPGRAVTTDGGYLLSGEWSFASGIKHAEIIHTGSQVQETGEIRLCVLPKEQATLIDNWDVMGLRATGSIDYTIDSVFVREPFTYMATTDVPRRGGNLYTLGIVNFGMICHSAWALGVGHRMLDELRKLVLERSGRPGSLGDNQAFLGEFAMAEAKWRAAHALVYETWNDVQDTLRQGDRMSVEQNTATRLALQHTTWNVEEVCLFVYTAAATTALRAGTLQRFFRDMHAGTQHFTSGPLARQACGLMAAGLGSEKRWQFLALVDAQ